MEKTNHVTDTHISNKNNQINNAHSTDFQGLTLDSILSWKMHIDQLTSKTKLGMLCN
jgi:hypothetical protein